MEKILSDWNHYNSELRHHFTNRDRDQALPIMNKAIELFKQFLFATNGMNQELHSIEECKLKPVNVLERLEFVTSRPGLFQSYKQLAELFAEQEKQYARKTALNHAKNKRPD
ncbi:MULTISPECIES: YpoC family protein [unclassified Mesobacillus]|jgi:hypothetical protein|uniref:YpoC family protein n=1 Tax=unclassified Mesobacillus TaxID=2675270 RepID=UPI00203EDD9E|nr:MULTISPECIES: hypothetical protein [unclassified Mesobacillus]MCM3122162.1 hypothetical protein [Mesobacillus sp. MER 33]MCM3232126.1 hypothetical protein [Mesobacillus sp. MER 48]